MVVSRHYKVRRAFGRAARDYSNQAVLQREVSERLLARLGYVRLKPTCVLDVGAGTGHVSGQVMQLHRRAHVYALDFAVEMLQKFYADLSWLQKRRSTMICADAGALPFADASFDLVISSLTFQWCTDLGQVLKEAERVLKPGGLLLFATLGPGTLQELRSSWAGADTFEHVNRFVDLRDVGDVMQATGFADPVTDIDRITMTYPDVSGLMRDLKAIGANTVQLGAAQGLTGKQRFQRMRQNYEQFRAAGVLPATYEIVYGHGWKFASKPTTQMSKEIYVSVDSLKNNR